MTQMMAPSRDISDRVHHVLLGLAGRGWVCFLLAFLPMGNVRPDFSAGALAGAFVSAWVSAGASLWACARTGRKGCYWAAGISLPLAVACGLVLYWELTKAF